MSSSDGLLSAKEAEVIVRQHLEALGLADEIANRAVTLSDERETFKVVFTPPPGVRAGDFTVIISKDGQILNQKFER